MRSAFISQPLRSRSLQHYETGVVRAAVVLQKCSPLASRRHTSMNAAATKGQILRGHGDGGWADAGWDLDKHTLEPELRRLVLAYGEMSQASYDNLGMDRCQLTYGYSVQQPTGMLAYLTGEYPLTPGAPKPADARGTNSWYKLPPVCADGLSPIIHAKPGKASGSEPCVGRGQRGVLQAVADKLFDTVAGALVTFVDGSNGGRRLFMPDPETGRGVEKRGTFIGFVAVSEPAGAEREVDVAVVWRGTIFKEEWESNFSQNKLTQWVQDPVQKANFLELSSSAKLQTQPSADGDEDGPSAGADYTPAAAAVDTDRDVYAVPTPSQVGVHDGFDDLYNRRIEQPEYTERVRGGQQDEDSPEGMLSPRQALRLWLPRLFKVHNVTTITSTGHSLGGGLATISAFGAADLLKQMWDSEEWTKQRTDKASPWQTQEKPKVSMVTFASPRVGNYSFGRKFRDMGVRGMRVVNKGDLVPNVPGLVVQGLSSIVEAVPFGFGKRAAIDMDSPLVRGASWLYYQVSRVTSKLYPDYWGFFHVGQVLQVDPAAAADTVKSLDTASKHNLELYMHLVSRTAQPSTSGAADPASSAQRNALLLNKSADIWTEPYAPADWWGAAPPAAPLHRRCRLVDGRWTVPLSDSD